MASLRKRGNYYYIRFTKMVNGETSETSKSLGITQKKKAKEACRQLEEMEEMGEIDPYSESFEPQKILQERSKKRVREKNLRGINTVRKAADYFYKKKAHLSDKTVNVGAEIPSEWGAYQRAIENFIKVNDCADVDPRLLTIHHFEEIIFKPGIETPTRKFYYRQLRAWWNYLLSKNIVSDDIFKQISSDMPESKDNVRQKMINEKELQQIFNTFDEELQRKKKLPEFRESWIQHWFKPMIACYFYGGLRKSEVGYDPDLDYSGLKGNNLEYMNGELEMIFIPATKGRTERVIPISQKWKDYLIPYLECRGSIGHDNYVFVYSRNSKKGWPVTGDRAYREFKRYAKLAGLPKSRTLHGMRHEWVTRSLENGYTLRETQLMAGHSSITVTEGYAHLVGRKLLKKQRKLDENK